MLYKDVEMWFCIKKINDLGLDEFPFALLTIFSHLQIPFLLLKWIYPC